MIDFSECSYDHILTGGHILFAFWIMHIFLLLRDLSHLFAPCIRFVSESFAVTVCLYMYAFHRVWDEKF